MSVRKSKQTNPEHNLQNCTLLVLCNMVKYIKNIYLAILGDNSAGCWLQCHRCLGLPLPSPAPLQIHHLRCNIIYVLYGTTFVSLIYHLRPLIDVILSYFCKILTPSQPAGSLTLFFGLNCHHRPSDSCSFIYPFHDKMGKNNLQLVVKNELPCHPIGLLFSFDIEKIKFSLCPSLNFQQNVAAQQPLCHVEFHLINMEDESDEGNHPLCLIIYVVFCCHLHGDAQKLYHTPLQSFSSTFLLQATLQLHSQNS